MLDCQEVAELLKDKEFDLAYTPDLKRNTDTLNEVLKYHPKTKIIIDNRLRERKYGDLQGLRHLDLMKKNLIQYLEYHRSYDVPPPNGESIKMVEDRVGPLFEEVLNKIKEARINVAVCAGNNSMRVMRRYLEDLTTEQMMKIENPFDSYFEYKI
jgi:2,3-bisphosphoglycerate-dependent phosphoglycerate mutase